MVFYNKIIDGQCGTCKFAKEFVSDSGDPNFMDKVHCSSEKKADTEYLMAEWKIRGWMDLWRLECLAEETFRCKSWRPRRPRPGKRIQRRHGRE